MDFIQLKIEKDDSMTKYITIVRKFDRSMSAKTIRRRIDKNEFITGYDLERYDVSEVSDGNKIDGKKIFRDMLEELRRAGARISLYQDGDMLSMEYLDYRLKIPDEMWRQVKRDIYREIEDFSGERQRICRERLRRFIMNSIEFGQKCIPYNRQYKDIFGYVPCRGDYSCSQDEYFQALLKAIETKRELSTIVHKKNRDYQDPHKRY